MPKAKFSAAWLALREPADIAARNREVRAACARAFARRRKLVICDIGAGTGATVRALADVLPTKQTWFLIDHDRRNLAAARERLAVWADSAKTSGDALVLRRGRREIVVRTEVRDLVAAPLVWPEEADLVTASALFDLCSRAWIGRLVKSLRGLPLLATLTFDGHIAVEPAHPHDAAIADSFRAHQRRDKGFGPAAGPKAADVLERALARGGYKIVAGDSPWIIDATQKRLLAATVDGMAQAAREVGEMSARDIDLWQRETVKAVSTLTIGHRDLFARSPRAR